MKACTGCHTEKHLDEFSNMKRNADGKQPKCKACNKAQAAEYYNKNKDEIRAKAAVYRREFHEHVLNLESAYRLKHKERKKIKNQEYSRKRRQLHPDAARLAERKWRQTHPENVRLARHRYRARRAGATVNTVPINILQLLIDFYGNCCMFPDCLSMQLTLDHVVPLSIGGVHDVDNLQILCKTHNSRKCNRNSVDFRDRKSVV